MKKPPYSPLLRLWLPLMVLAAILPLGTSLVVHQYRDSIETLQQRSYNDVKHDITHVQSYIAQALRRGDMDMVELIVTSLATEVVYRHVALFDERGRVIAATHYTWKGQPIDKVAGAFDPVLPQRMRRQSQPVIEFPTKNTIQAWFPVHFPAQNKLRQERIGGLYIDYDFSRDAARLADRLQDQLLIYWLGLLVATGLILLLLYFWLHEPLGLLLRATRRLGEGDLHTRVEIDGKGELPALARSFNDMVRRLENTTQQLRILSAAVQQAGEMVMITDPEGRIEYVNPAFCEVTGYGREEAIGKKISLLKSGEHEEGYYREMWKAIEAGHYWRSKIVNRRKDGSSYSALMSISPVYDRNGSINYFVCIQQDMSDYERLEQQLRQLQKLEAVGTLVGGIAHEFNNILAAIMGKVYLARRETQAGEYIDTALEDINRVSERAAVMVRQLLAYSRKGGIDLQPVSMCAFLQEMLSLHKVVLPENIALKVTMDEPPLTIRADATLLQQLILNLLNNARDAVVGQASPRIELTLRRWRADPVFLARHEEVSAGDYVCLSVRDNGTGIPEEDQERIFDPFFTTKEVGEGTGLGLSMVLGAVQAHSGVIEVDSRPGAGACFCVYLPLVMEEVAADGSAEEAAIEEGQGETVLLVDDEDSVRQTTAEVLESLGYRVLTAANGEAGLACFREHADVIDLLLTDVVMPGMGGVELASEIRADRPDMPVLYASGYDQAQVTEGTAITADEILAKPFSQAELSRHLQQALQRHHRHSH